WIEADMSVGHSSPGTNGEATVPNIDRTGNTGAAGASYITITNPWIELDPDFCPPNYTAATATNITTLPYQVTDLKNTENPSFGRRLWWTWTADITDRVHVVAWNSN